MNPNVEGKRPLILGILAAMWVVGGITLLVAALGAPSPSTQMAGASSGASAVFIAAICAAAAARRRRRAG